MFVTTAETLDYPDFYHRRLDVAEDTNVAGQEIIFLALLTFILYTYFQIVSTPYFKKAPGISPMPRAKY